jgi:dynein heavy chain, axonemal
MYHTIASCIDFFLKHCGVQTLEALFVHCVVWSCGAVIVQRPGNEDRDRFDSFLKGISGMSTLEGDVVSAAQLPSKSMYDFLFDVENKCWKNWKGFVGEYKPPASGKFSEVVVPTADLVRSMWILKTILTAEKPCLFVGESGTAKSVAIQKYLYSLDPMSSMVLGLNFSSRTKSADVQRGIEDSTEKRAKDTFGPPIGKKLYLFLDDLNMPKVDSYGTQQPIALLKLFIERGGFYDRGKELNWMKMKDITCVAAMGPPGGARNEVDPRFISLFNVFEIQFPSSENLRTIFQSILRGHMSPFKEEIRAASEQLTDMTLAIYNFVIEKLPPTPKRFHYIFNLRDLSRVFEGLLRSTPDKFVSAPQFMRLWRNEIMRIFHDRLIDEHDKQLFLEQAKGLVHSRCSSFAEQVMADPILFGDFKHAASVIGDPSADVVRFIFCRKPCSFIMSVEQGTV